MKQILIIEDDVHIGNMLEEALTREGYGVLRAYSGTEAVMALSKHRPSLVLLDLMLPGLSGEEVLPQIKGIPVIVVSAKADADSKASLLLGGAADYVTKPFDMKELLARIVVRLRSAAALESSFLSFADIILDTNLHTVMSSENVNKPGSQPASPCAPDAEAACSEIKLTRTEYAILKLLMQNPAQVVTKSQLLERISFDTPDCTESSLKMHISNLRRKLRNISGKEYIEAVWGIGFKLRDE